jgi:hypothetical protein
VLVAATGTWHASAAAFSGATTGPGSQWQSGSVALDAGPASAVIAVGGARPGSFGAGCVKVTYTGSLAAGVRLYLRAADVGGTGLADHLTLQISAGTGDDSGCADFTPAAVVYNAAGLTDTTRTATAFSAASFSYATGVDGWAATTAATRTYQIKWQLQDDNAARSRTASLTFTWEAQDL